LKGSEANNAWMLEHPSRETVRIFSQLVPSVYYSNTFRGPFVMATWLETSRAL